MRALLFGLFPAVFFLLPGYAQDSSDMNTTFTNLADRYLENLLESSPITATNLGDHRFDSMVDEVDMAARDRRVRSAKAFLEEMESLNVAALSRENQVDFSLLQQALQKEIWQIETLREWEWNPLIYSGIPGNAIYGLLSRGSTPLSERLIHAANRCRKFPRLFEQARASMVKERTPQIHAETAIDQNRGIIKLIEAVLVAEIDKLSGEQKTDLEEAIQIAREAVNTHQTWLESELLPNAKGNPRISEKLFREKFAYDLFSSLSPEELFARAEAEKISLHERMYELSKQIYADRHPDFQFPANPSQQEKKKLIRTCLEFAGNDAPPANGVVDAANHSLKITTDFIRKKDLVSLPDDQLEIILMPEFRRGVSVAYCDAPGPLETGGKTFYAVSPPPADWSDEQVNSFLREYNYRSLHNLTVHEAMPGHYVQLLRSNATSSPLRSVLRSGTFIEGWAVYSESMMVEQGFLPDDLLMRLVVLKWNLRGVTNALLDQMIHLKGINEETAMKLMVDDAFQEEREAAGKYRRSLLTSVQLSTYFAGYLEVLDIRAAAEKAWGDSFTLKSFHDRIMAFGSPPPIFVEALLLEKEIPLPH